MDKAFWQGIVDTDYTIPSTHTLTGLTRELCSFLGSTDPQLRDSVAYPILAAWITRGLYTGDELRAMAQQLGENLKVGLGEQGSNTIFLRSFSALVLAAMVYQQNRHPFLDEAELRRLLEQALAYYSAEQDLRGYIPGPGWAHAVAHGADLLRLLSANPTLGEPDLERILEALAAKIAPPAAHVYLYNEEQRITRAVLVILNRNLLALPFLSAWLERLTRYEDRTIGIETFLDGEPPIIASKVAVSVLHNTRQFLSALYLHLITDEERPAIATDFAPLVLAALQPMNTW